MFLILKDMYVFINRAPCLNHVHHAQPSHNLAMISFSMEDPLVKWLSDALPVIFEVHCLDPNNGKTMDNEGKPLQTVADEKKDTWGELSSHSHACVRFS